MSGDLYPWLFGLACLLLFAGLSSVLAVLLERSSPIRLSHWAEESGGRLRAVYSRPRRFEAFRFLLSVAARLSLLAAVVFVAISPLPPLGALPAVVWVTLAIGFGVALLELLNRRLVRNDPEAALTTLTRLYGLALACCRPLLPVVSALMPDTELERPGEEDDEEASEQEIEAFIDVGTREGVLDNVDSELVRGVVDFRLTRARSVMTPRIDVVCAPVESSLEELLQIFVESTHTRIPLYESSIDQIVGVLHLRDLIRGQRAAEPPAPRELVKPVLYVPESRPLDEVLKELQERRQQLAVVVDEYGGTAGILTIEDLLEEIVGEIVDQDEEMPPQATQLEDGSWRFDGRIRIDELARVFDLTLDDESVDTLGGMLFNVFGYVPRDGESIEAHGLRFTVEEVVDRRIQLVRVEEVPSTTPSEDTDVD